MATAILLGSVVVLSQLLSMGRTQAQKAQQHSEAQRVCADTLNEIVLGLRPLLAVEMAPLEPPFETRPVQRQERPNASELIRRQNADALSTGSNAKWYYSVRLAPHPSLAELTILTVEVRQARTNRTRPVAVLLTRWVRREMTETESPPDFQFRLGASPTPERGRSGS